MKPGEGAIDGCRYAPDLSKGSTMRWKCLPTTTSWLVHSTDLFPVGTEVGIQVDPFDIQIMKKPESEDEEARRT